MRLAGRVAVVTGAGRGIGRAIAVALAREGAAIVVSSRTQTQLDETLALIRAAGSDGCTVVADAADRAQSREPVRQAVAQLGRIDVLVNNVGGTVGPVRDAYSCDDEWFEYNVMLNLTSAYWTSREALPHMKAQGYGRIINIGSGAARFASGNLPYVTAKHGMIGLTRALAAASATDGITVNMLSPGWTNTSLVDFGAIGKRMNMTPEQARDWAGREALQHRVLEPEELAPMAVLLASPEGGGITGQMLNVDGGYRV